MSEMENTVIRKTEYKGLISKKKKKNITKEEVKIITTLKENVKGNI